jgi:hypothetical protein
MKEGALLVDLETMCLEGSIELLKDILKWIPCFANVWWFWGLSCVFNASAVKDFAQKGYIMADNFILGCVDGVDEPETPDQWAAYHTTRLSESRHICLFGKCKIRASHVYICSKCEGKAGSRLHMLGEK